MSKTVKTFVQRASGRVKLKVVKGSNHCSITEPEIDIAYAIVAHFDVAALDDRGFLFDARLFGMYFQALAQTPTELSCEKLCMKITRDLVFNLGERKRFCQKLEVTIEPFVGVNVTYIAERGEM